jgi:hypothetical protein
MVKTLPIHNFFKFEVVEWAKENLTNATEEGSLYDWEVHIYSDSTTVNLRHDIKHVRMIILWSFWRWKDN